jgi:hypothetical protein
VRASQQEQTGGVGVSEVTAAFQRIGWGPVPNAQHDLGTDLFVQARDARLFDRGLPVGVQAKGGPSYFEQPAYAPDGSLLGWWYPENDVDHFDDWVTHALPHLVVLHNLDTHKSYWVHVTAQAVKSTGKGAKILVPANQTIDHEHLDDLLAVATSSKPVIGLEGTAWAASASNIAPARRLRHALLVPRLVAPHPNTGFGTVLGPEQAVALLALGRVRALNEFAKRHDAVPSLEEAASSRDWRWRFVATLQHWLVNGDRNAVTATMDNAPNPASRAATLRVCAHALADRTVRHGVVGPLPSAATGRSDLASLTPTAWPTPLSATPDGRPATQDANSGFQSCSPGSKIAAPQQARIRSAVSGPPYSKSASL